MKPKIIKENKTCKTCDREYESHKGQLGGIIFEFGGGNCADCSQRLDDEEQKRQSDTQTLKLKETRESWRKTCGIPLRFQQSRFEKFDKKVDKTIISTLNDLRQYAQEFSFQQPQLSKSLVMFSTSWGLGKTYLACSLAHAVLDKWNNEIAYCPIMFISEPQLFLRIRTTYNKPNFEEHKETEEDIYRKLTRVPLLILDDMGKEEVSDPRFVQRVLFAVIDGRYQNMLPVVITANLDTDMLLAHLGGGRGNCASMDRLAEMTGGKFRELKGESYRDGTKRLPARS